MFWLLSAILQGIADLLIDTFKEEKMKRSSSQFVHNPETDALAGRVREIARSALNMSEMELEEFFDAESTIDQAVSFTYKQACVCLCIDLFEAFRS